MEYETGNIIHGRVIKSDVDKATEILLESNELIEDYPIGALVKIKGMKHEFLGLITNAKVVGSPSGFNILSNKEISSETKETLIKVLSNDLRDQIIEVALIAKREIETGDYGRADVAPAFNSPLLDLTMQDVKDFYIVEDEFYVLGKPKSAGALEVGIPLNMDKLVDLSFAIYGKSGSGKTFLGNIIAGYITLYDRKLTEKREKGVKLLIFDMHSEYGLELRDNRGNKIADGIGTIFKDFYQVYTPDLKLAKERGLEPLAINIKDIAPEDIQLIAPIFGISQTFVSHIHTFKNIIEKSDSIKLGDLWFLGLFDGFQLEEELEKTEEGKEILAELKNRLFENGLTLENMRSKIFEEIKRREGYQVASSYRTQTSKLRRFLKYPITYKRDTVSEIIEKVLNSEHGNIIISLGKYEKETPLYMVLANLIARRLRNRIMEMEEEGETPKNKVIIFLEEAHNFLSGENFRLSPFGDIAREMRKKGVTLCIIDQKPGELHTDVVSMIWTSFVFSLTDKKDIEQAIMGVDKADLFRKIVPTLSPREVLAFGEAVKFPVVIQVMDYKKVEEKFKEYVSNIQKEIRKKEDDLSEGGFI
ncbi:MAG: ATP-binding protein [Candidatus Njordarchaeia archaeon]